MKFTINIKKLHFVILLFVIIIAGFVIAYGGSQPQVMGHSGGEVDATINYPGLGTQTYSLNYFIQNIYDREVVDDGALSSVNGSVTTLENKVNNCPTGMTKVHDFCVDSSPRSATTWTGAVTNCNTAGLRLCSTIEWSTACLSLGPNGWATSNDGDWAGSLVNNNAAMRHGVSNSCTIHGIENYGTIRIYRCCKNMI